MPVYVPVKQIQGIFHVISWVLSSQLSCRLGNCNKIATFLYCYSWKGIWFMLLRRCLILTVLYRDAHTVVFIVNTFIASTLVWDSSNSGFLATKTIKESFDLEGEGEWVKITCCCITSCTLQSDKSTGLSSQSPLQFGPGHGLMWLCHPGQAALKKTVLLLTYRFIRHQLWECSQGFKGLEMTKIFFVLHLKIWRVTVGCLFFWCIFLYVVAANLGPLWVFWLPLHSSMPSEKCIYYCCCSVFLGDGDAIFSLTPLLSLAFFMMRRHELASHRFFHYHSGCLLSKDEEYK